MYWSPNKGTHCKENKVALPFLWMNEYGKECIGYAGEMWLVFISSRNVPLYWWINETISTKLIWFWEIWRKSWVAYISASKT